LTIIKYIILIYDLLTSEENNIDVLNLTVNNTFEEKNVKTKVKDGEESYFIRAYNTEGK
jgi:hypothetical protein